MKGKDSRDADDLCRKMALGLNLLIKQESKKQMSSGATNEHRRSKLKTKKTISKRGMTKPKSKDTKTAKIKKRSHAKPKKEDKKAFFKLSQKFRDSLDQMKTNIVENKILRGSGRVNEKTNQLIPKKKEEGVGKHVDLSIRPGRRLLEEEEDGLKEGQELGNFEPPMIRNEDAIRKEGKDSGRSLTIRELEMAQIITPRILGIPNNENTIFIPPMFLGIQDSSKLNSKPEQSGISDSEKMLINEQEAKPKIEKKKPQITQLETAKISKDEDSLDCDFEEIERQYQKFKRREAMKMQGSPDEPEQDTSKQDQIKPVQVKPKADPPKPGKFQNYKLSPPESNKMSNPSKAIHWNVDNEIEWGFMKSELKNFLDFNEIGEVELEGFDHKIQNILEENLKRKLSPKSGPALRVDRSERVPKKEDKLKNEKIERIFREEQDLMGEYKNPLEEIEKTLDESFIQKIKSGDSGKMKLSLESLGRIAGKQGNYWDLSYYLDPSKGMFVFLCVGLISRYRGGSNLE